MPSIKQLTYFIQIVEDDGFSHAAEKLYIAQSALSRQIKLLEDEIGFDVFDRSERKVKLTQAGHFFYVQVKNNLLNLSHIIENSKNIADGYRRLIKIAHSSSVVMSLEKLKILNQTSQQLSVDFEINTLSSEYQISALKKGEIDIGLIRLSVLNSLDGLNVAHLYHEPLFVALHQDHILAQEKSISLTQLSTEKFVSTPHPERGGLSYLVSNLCLTSGFVPQKASVQSRKFSQLQLVAANLGICIVPEEFKRESPDQVKMVQLKHENAFSDVVMIWKTDSDEVVNKSADDLIGRLTKSKLDFIG